MPTITVKIDVPADAAAQTYGAPKVAGVQVDTSDCPGWAAFTLAEDIMAAIKTALKQFNPEKTSIKTWSLHEVLPGYITRRVTLNSSLKTVGELIGLTADEVLAIPSIGHGSLSEIRECLEGYGLKLKDDA